MSDDEDVLSLLHEYCNKPEIKMSPSFSSYTDDSQDQSSSESETETKPKTSQESIFVEHNLLNIFGEQNKRQFFFSETNQMF